MSAQNLAFYSAALACMLLVSGTWLASRGRKVGFFFVLVAVTGIFATVIK